MDKKDGTSRRAFLALAGTAAPAAAMATMTGEAAEAAEVDPTSERMQDTAHTRAYYAAARF
ncbi:MAG: twin-arginine translocation pathway signal protein [Pseudomonadota bacterium]